MRLQSPRRYLRLLDFAEQSNQGLRIARVVLDAAGSQAYLDVREPLGTGGLGNWLLALVQPNTWRKHPHWVQAIEQHLTHLTLLTDEEPATGGSSGRTDYLWN